MKTLTSYPWYVCIHVFKICICWFVFQDHLRKSSYTENRLNGHHPTTTTTTLTNTTEHGNDPPAHVSSSILAKYPWYVQCMWEDGTSRAGFVGHSDHLGLYRTSFLKKNSKHGHNHVSQIYWCFINLDKSECFIFIGIFNLNNNFEYQHTASSLSISPSKHHVYIVKLWVSTKN